MDTMETPVEAVRAAPKPARKPRGPNKVKAAPRIVRAEAEVSQVDTAALMQSPEIQAAIAAAVASATAKIVSDLESKRAQTGSQSNAGDNQFAQMLALELARVADQGNKQKRVAPAEMVRRENARELMESLIVEARSQDDVPEYELIRETYLEEQLIKPTYVDRNTHVQMRTRIKWAGVPNEAMQPVNEVARGIYREFINSIGGSTAPINRPNAHGDLSVLHQSDIPNIPMVGRPRGSLEIVGRDTQGQVIETAVLGSVAPRAKQIA